MVVLPSQQRYAASTPPTYQRCRRKPAIHQVSCDSPRASSSAVGRESGSSGDGRHAAVARKRWGCCSAVQRCDGELPKCRAAHTRRRLLDSTSARPFAAGELAVDLVISKQPPRRVLGTSTDVPIMATASLAAQQDASPACRLCRAVSGAALEGGQTCWLGRKTPFSRSSDHREPVRVSSERQIPTVWLLASRPTIPLFIRPLLD